ncbi:hypothetical protein A6R68_02830 [Neotoma lepida]|uniref:Uncharacterized protein n=1 Tax=Neotoma lepida TaxID=56216 RepID=A0A1A6GRW2_NEOLE|nr:hypothetical protein A6R68_02830 [Neotoma lepida]
MDNYKSKLIKGLDEDDLLGKNLSGSSGTNKTQKMAQDLINSIDQTRELLAMFEDNKLMVLNRKEQREQKDRLELWIQLNMQNSVKADS